LFCAWISRRKNEEDLKLTTKYVKAITKAGIDEVALFIMTPVPGSKASTYSTLGYKKLSELNFSPKWRKEYKRLSTFRTKTYIQFLFWKLCYHPLKLLKQPFNVLTGRFNTKMEMTLYRVLKVSFLGKILARN